MKIISRKQPNFCLLSLILDKLTDVEDDLKIYPNPIQSNQNLYVDYHSILEEELVEIFIYKPSGSIIISSKIKTIKGFKSYEINTNKLQTGIYFVELISNGVKVATKKIIMN